MPEPITAARLDAMRERYLDDAHWARTPDIREEALVMVDVVDLALIGLAAPRSATPAPGRHVREQRRGQC